MLGGTNVSPKDELGRTNYIIHLTLMSRVQPFLKLLMYINFYGRNPFVHICLNAKPYGCTYELIHKINNIHPY